MAALITVAIVIVLLGVAVGAFLGVSLAIGREDRRRGALRFAAPSNSTRAARTMVGVNRSGWE